MKLFTCLCGATIHFENTVCVSCGRALGWCPACGHLTALVPGDAGTLRCGWDHCSATLRRCHNNEVEGVCNRTVAVPPGPPVGPPPFCDYCRLNRVIPDLSVPGNREKWQRLELAKRRLLYQLDLLRLPYGTFGDPIYPALCFDFKAGPPTSDAEGWTMGQEPVSTGYFDGVITLNLLEADDVEREKTRVNFREAHRTLIGHFRHEIGHYYWHMWVAGKREPDFVQVFGDHTQPPYAEAQQRYYAQGPPPGWQATHISAYATMHPWEDFAETFATYLDVVSVLDTAVHTGMIQDVDPLVMELPELVERYARVGVAANELNRAMGLTDLVPEVFTAGVVEKMAFVHRLVRDAQAQ